MSSWPKQRDNLFGAEMAGIAWPKLLGTQQLAATLFGGDSFRPLYPLVNILLFCLIIGAALFYRFNNEDIR